MAKVRKPSYAALMRANKGYAILLETARTERAIAQVKCNHALSAASNTIQELNAIRSMQQVAHTKPETIRTIFKQALEEVFIRRKREGREDKKAVLLQRSKKSRKR